MPHCEFVIESETAVETNVKKSKYKSRRKDRSRSGSSPDKHNKRNGPNRVPAEKPKQHRARSSGEKDNSDVARHSRSPRYDIETN